MSKRSTPAGTKPAKKGDKKAGAKPTSAASIEAHVSGPLGPWRLSIAVGVAAVTTGKAFVDAASSGGQIDLALGRSFAVAFVMWMVLGAVNRILIQAEVARLVDARTAAEEAVESTDTWTDADHTASVPTQAAA